MGLLMIQSTNRHYSSKGKVDKDPISPNEKKNQASKQASKSPSSHSGSFTPSSPDNQEELENYSKKFKVNVLYL
ncbi:hypothetical protein DSO57_1036812 [Entomophthora muscae]|uniref:Uncharacterized protein n=1 Tax=Entomophthora muscae TaxID=34485 RepID=A0ACC2RQ19_9FUNG|nr:hypothetical protein DSO57_1036812 [Entomophthora muscae]